MFRSLFTVAVVVWATTTPALAGDIIYHTGRAAYSVTPAGNLVDVAFNDGNGYNHFASENYIFYGDTLGQTVTHWFNYRWLDTEAEPLNVPGEFRLGISHRPGGDPNAHNSGMYDPYDGTAPNVPVNSVLIQLGTSHGRTIVNPTTEYNSGPTITQYNDTTVLYEWPGEGPNITDIVYHVDKGVSVQALFTTYVTINPQRPTIIGNAPPSGGGGSGGSGVINPGGFGGGGGGSSNTDPLGQGLPNPTDDQGNELKVASQKPGRGGDTIDLNNITPDTGRDSVTIIIEYKVPDILPQDLVAESLRMFLFEPGTNQFTQAGTNDMGLTAPTNTLGDFGVNIVGDTVQVWTNINHASTYVVAGEVIPEPATLLVLIPAAIAVMGRRRAA